MPPHPDPPVATPADLPASDRQRWVGLVILAGSQLMIVLDVTIINVALPSIKAELGITATEQQWLITGYTVPERLFGPTWFRATTGSLA